MSETMTNEQETWRDKIVKLLRKAENTSSAAEAEVFSKKAEELMIKWGIEEAVIQHALGEQTTDVIIEHRVKFTGIYRQAVRDHLGSGVGNGMGFKVFISDESWSRPPTTSVYWVGFKSDIDRAAMLLTSLEVQAARGMREFFEEWKRDNPWMKSSHEAYKARRSFLIGFGDEVRTRLVMQCRKAAKEATAQEQAAATTAGPTTEGSSVALVLADRQRRVQDYYDTNYGHLRSGRARSVLTGMGGYNAGRAAGARASFGGPSVSGNRGSIGSGS